MHPSLAPWAYILPPRLCMPAKARSRSRRSFRHPASAFGAWAHVLPRGALHGMGLVPPNPAALLHQHRSNRDRSGAGCPIRMARADLKFGDSERHGYPTLPPCDAAEESPVNRLPFNDPFVSVAGLALRSRSAVRRTSRLPRHQLNLQVHPHQLEGTQVGSPELLEPQPGGRTRAPGSAPRLC